MAPHDADTDRPSLALSLPPYVWAIHLLAFGVFALVPVLLLANFRQEAFDLGIYDQSIWLLSRGQDFNTVGGAHVFGGHFSPILYLLAPLSWVPGGAVPELVGQAWIVASAVFPIHLMCERLSLTSRPFLLVFALHPGVFTATWFGFHPWTLAAPFLAWAVLALLSRPRWEVLSLMGIGGLAFREDIGFWVVLLGAMIALAARLSWKDWLVGSILPGVASAWVVFRLIPSVSPVADYLFSSSYLGETPTVSLSSFTGSTVVRIAYLILPIGLGLSSLRRLNWRIAAPLIIPLIGLALRDGNALATAFHYDLHLALGTILWVMLTGRDSPSPKTAIVGSLVAALAFGALRPTTPHIGPNPWGLLNDAAPMKSLHQRITDLSDGDTSMSLPTQLVPHFSERANIFIYPWPFDRPLNHPFDISCSPPDLVIRDVASRDAPGWLRARADYELIESVDRYRVYAYEGPVVDEPGCD